MHNGSDASRKICSLDRLIAERRRADERSERVVHCHGCFDIVHPGHVRHLEHARRLGERLIVSITADEYIDKGVARPLFDQTLRAENLAALACVDWVLVNPAPTAAALLEAVKPDVYVKGAEYEHNDDPRFAAERDAVERHGGRVVFSSGDVVFSSTALIEAMRNDDGLQDPDAIDPRAVALRGLHGKHDLSAQAVGQALADVRDRKIVIIGESIIDAYVDCAWPDVTGEAPMLSLRPRQRVTFDGGAAVIARHAAAAGARPVLVTPSPRSIDGQAMCERLEEAGVQLEIIPCETPLPVKERFLVGREKLVKLDHTTPVELDRRTRERLVQAATALARDAGGAIVADFGLGMLGPRLTADLFEALRPRVNVLAGDVSGPQASLLHMRDADLLTPSERELRAILADASGSLPAVAAELAQRTRAARICVTMAEDGMVVFRQRETAHAPDGQPARLASDHVPALSHAPMDTLGCGDALLTFSTLMLIAGADDALSAYAGSLAAAVAAGRLGNHVVRPIDVIRQAERLHSGCRVVARAIGGAAISR